MGLGSEIRDPEKKPIPDPGSVSRVKKAPDPGSAPLEKYETSMKKKLFLSLPGRSA